MKTPNPLLPLLFILATGSGASTAPAAAPGTVATWGQVGNYAVPLAAQSGVIAVTVGASHTVVLKDDGSVVGWGFLHAPTGTVVFPAGSGVTAIAAGEAHTLALKSNGSVAAWGYNHAGQSTVPAAAQSGVIAVAAGEIHSLALKSDGSVVAWGDYHPPAGTLVWPAGSGVIAIAAGGARNAVLKNDGSVVAWENGVLGQQMVLVGAQSGVTAIAGGIFHTVALKNDGSLLVWGGNYSGQTNVPVAAQSGVAAIAAGYVHTAVLKSNGTVVAWGNNEEGQVTGTPTPVPPYSAIASPVTSVNGVTAIAAGGRSTVTIVTPAPPAILVPPASQTVNVWQNPGFTVTATGFPLICQWRKDGVDLAGATNLTYNLPLVQPGHAGTYTVVVSNALGTVTSAPAELTVRTNLVGTVVVWGTDYSGLPDVPVAAQSRVAAVSAGSSHLVALKNDGSVVAWGENIYGQLMMPATAQNGVSAIAAGGLHTLALKNDGSLVAWGAITNSDIGTWFDFGQARVPVAAQSGVTAIAAGFYHSVVLKNDGSVVAWGAGTIDASSFTNSGDNYGQYGQALVPLAARSGVTAVAAGWLHTLALKSDGSVIAWGDNRFGATTVPVAAQSGVIAISAGNGHSVALKNDGTVIAWGFNRYGGVTEPPTADPPYFATAFPVILGGQPLTGVSAIAAGSAHSAALKHNGTVVEWGDTGDGRTPVPNGLNGVTAIAEGNPYTVALVGSVPLLPSLNAWHNGNQLILSWPTNAPGFTLQSTPSLTPPVMWSDVSNAPALIDGKWTVTNSLSGGNQFYRLHRP